MRSCGVQHLQTDGASYAVRAPHLRCPKADLGPRRPVRPAVGLGDLEKTMGVVGPRPQAGGRTRPRGSRPAEPPDDGVDERAPRRRTGWKRRFRRDGVGAEHHEASKPWGRDALAQVLVECPLTPDIRLPVAAWGARLSRSSVGGLDHAKKRGLCTACEPVPSSVTNSGTQPGTSVWWARRSHPSSTPSAPACNNRQRSGSSPLSSCFKTRSITRTGLQPRIPDRGTHRRGFGFNALHYAHRPAR